MALDLEKLRSIGAISRRSGDRIRESRDAAGRPVKAVTDELGNTVTQRHDGQDVTINAARIAVQAQTKEVRD